MSRRRQATGIDSELVRGILADVYAERERQHAVWGKQRLDYPVWLTVLMEEVGEAAQAVLAYRVMADQLRLQHLRAELVQVAAVAVQIIEHIDIDEDLRS